MNGSHNILVASKPVGRGIAALLVLLMGLLVVTGATSRLDYLLYDSASRLSPRGTPDNILIVAIDDESLAELGPWPWPRERHEQLITRLQAGQPRAILYDVLFLSGTDPAADAGLGAAMAKAGRVVLPMLFQIPGTNGRGYDIKLPIAPLANAARLGHADIHPDNDGVVRRIDLALDGEQRWLHTVVQAAADDPEVAAAVKSLPGLAAQPATAPLKRTGSVLIDFAGGGGQIRSISFARVLRGELPAEFVQGRYVVVGATAAGQGDRFSTPTSNESGLLPGVEIQAYLLDTLLHGRQVVELGGLAQFGVGVLGILAVILAFRRLPPSAAPLAGLVVALAILLISAVLLAGFKLWLPPTAAIIIQILAQPLWAWRRLDAVSRFMVAELHQMNRENRITPAHQPLPLNADRVELQIALLQQAVGDTRNLRELVSTALHSLPDPTVMMASDGHIAIVNDAAKTLFGQGGDVTAAAMTERFRISHAGLPILSPQVLADPQGPWRGDKQDGLGNMFEIRAAPWMANDGSVMGWVVRFNDVTRLRRAEQQREEALQLLTHDMRVPQSAILAVIASHPGEISASLAMRLRHYATRTISLADGFLQLAKADAGKYEVATVDMADVLIEAVDDLWPISSAREIRVAAHGTDTPHLVLGNSSLLIRALVNLIGNAIKFSRDGDQINCDLRREVDASGAAFISCDIRDNGVGMSADVVASLFQRFRSHNKNSRNADGVGLGLNFVQAVIINHGGTINCSSRPNFGTTMRIRLPALSADADPVSL